MALNRELPAASEEMFLFLHPTCPGSRALWAFKLEADLPITLQEVNVAKEEHTKLKEWQRVNRSGRIPALIHGDLCLFEVGAIFEYLALSFPKKVPSHWLGPDRTTNPARRSKVREMVTRAQTQIGNPINALLSRSFHMLQQEITEKIPFEERDELESAILAPFRVFDGILANQPFVVDEEISVADLFVGAHVLQVALAPVDWSECVHLNQYVKRLLERPGFGEAHKWFQKSFKPEMHYRIATLYL